LRKTLPSCDRRICKPRILTLLKRNRSNSITTRESLTGRRYPCSDRDSASRSQSCIRYAQGEHSFPCIICGSNSGRFQSDSRFNMIRKAHRKMRSPCKDSRSRTHSPSVSSSLVFPSASSWRHYGDPISIYLLIFPLWRISFHIAYHFAKLSTLITRLHCQSQ
jgi:hypothetical protein